MFFHNHRLVAGLLDAAEASEPHSIVALGSANPTLVKGGPGVITALHCINVNAAVRYIKFYDMNKAPTAGSPGIVRRFGIPGAAAGAGFTFPLFLPMKFKVGIAYVLVTGSADSDATAVTAGDIILDLEYV